MVTLYLDSVVVTCFSLWITFFYSSWNNVSHFRSIMFEVKTFIWKVIENVSKMYYILFEMLLWMNRRVILTLITLSELKTWLLSAFHSPNPNVCQCFWHLKTFKQNKYSTVDTTFDPILGFWSQNMSNRCLQTSIELNQQ